jgi:hypothetical protein
MARTQEEILEDIASSLKSQGLKTPTSPTGGTTSGPVPTGTGVITGLIEDLAKLRQGASATGTVLGDIAGVLGKVWAPLGALGTQQVQALQGTVGSMNQLNQQGVNFGQNIANFNEKLANAGTTPEKFTQIMSTVGPRLQGLGASGGQAADGVLTALGEFKSKYGKTMTDLGMTNDQQNEYFAKYLQDRKFTDLSEKKSRQGLVDEAGANAQELAKYAQLSGKSIGQLQAEQNARSENIDMQAEIMMGGKEMQEAFGRVNSQLGDLGPGINDLAGEILTGGIRTAEGSAKFAALGPAGAELEKAIMMQKDAKTADQKIAADQALARAKDQADEYMRSKEFLRNLQNDKSEVGQAQRQFFKENQARLSSTVQAQTQLQKQGKPSDIAAAKDYQANIANANIQGIDPKTGKRNESAQVVQGMNQADATAQNAAIVGSSKITGIAIKGLGEVVDRTAGKIPNMYMSPEQIQRKIAGAGGGENQAPRVKLNPKDTRDTGTLGMTGSLFETKDFFGKVQKGETVLTPDQLTNLVKGAQKSAMPDLANIKQPPASGPDAFKSVFNDMQKNMKMPTGIEKMAGGIPNMQDMFAGIQTKVSGIATDAKTKSDAVQKSQTDQPKTVAERAEEYEASRSASSSGSEEPAQKDMLEALNSLNKMMGQLVSLQDTNNNIAEGMQRKISSNNRFVA